MGDNLFSLYFNNQEIILPKKDVKFKNGLGIIEAYGCINISDINIDIPLIGVVDTSFSLVFPLLPKELVVKLDILENGLVCIIKERGEYINSDTVVYHYAGDDSYELDASSYEVINPKTIKLVLRENGKYLFGLYNVTTNIATPYFDKLGPFTANQGNQTRVAVATAFIYDGDTIINSISCTLDEYGNVVSNYKEANNGEEFAASMELIDIVNFLKGISR